MVKLFLLEKLERYLGKKSSKTSKQWSGMCGITVKDYMDFQNK